MIFFFYCLAVLPQKVISPLVKDLRRQEIDIAKGKYNWRDRPVEGQMGWNLPGYLNVTKPEDLPRFFLRQDARERAFEEHTTLAGIAFLMDKFVSKFYLLRA